jgi:hypothetical protein
MDITRKLLIRAVVAVTAVKLVFAFVYPIKNDEAYYLLWAKHLAGGYYDHPPMIGWLLHLMSRVSDAIFWYRLLAIGTGLIAVWVVYRFALRFADEQRARLAALLFVLSPLYILLFLIGNDSPLLLFSSLGALLFYVALERERPLLAVGSGALLGAAILSKYLVIPLLLALVLFTWQRSSRRHWAYLGLAALGALPFAMQHLYYNYTHCWDTVNFHFFLRNVKTEGGVSSLAFYFAGLALMMTPWGLWYLFKQRRTLAGGQYRYLVTIALTFTVFFALSSLKTVIGLHFFLAFAPCLFALYAVVEEPVQRRRMVQFSVAYAVLFAGVFAALAAWPLDKLKGWKYHPDFVLALDPREICVQLEPYAGYAVFSNYYATAAILSYECKRDVNVLFGSSQKGREFDRWTDQAALDGKSVAIVSVGKKDIGKTPPAYFDRSRVETISVRGAPFTVFVGEGFKYARYRDEIMAEINEKYRRPPSWLPRRGCPQAIVGTVSSGE